MFSMVRLAWRTANNNQLKIKNMNKDLLFQLYAIHSPSGCEKKMRRFLKKQASACGATSVVQDSFGNLLITKGVSDTYPCLAAHMDQVQNNHSKDFTVFEYGDVVFAFSEKSGAQQGLGADDKNGIFICLECLRKYDVLKVAFFAGEEVGCVGSRQVDLDFFRDCRFIVEPDRMNGNDLITSMSVGDVCSDEFITALGAEQFGYKEAVGSITDVGELVERGVGISCLNLSCGYYNAHSDKEITRLSELENCLCFVGHIIETCTDVYPFEHSYTRVSRGGMGFGRYYNWYTDEDEYFDGGYYDGDVDTMADILKADPNISLSDILRLYGDSFYAYEFFDKTECNNQLSDIYDLCKNGDSDAVGDLFADYHLAENPKL